jgi:hypothetical protein
VPDNAAGAVTACPDCGKKLRIPAARPAPSAARPAPQPKKPAAPAADAGGGYGVLPAPERAEIPQEELRTPLEYRMDEEDTEEEPQEDQEEPEQEERPRKRKKIRKRRRTQSTGLSRGAIIGLSVGGGFLVLVAVTVLLFFMLPGRGSKKEDMNQLVADLQQAGAQIERDESRPDKPIVAISFRGQPINGKLLGRLKAIPTLRKLDLGGTLMSDVLLEHLEDVTQISILNLGHCNKITSHGLEFLKNFKNLEELNLSQTLVMDDGLEHLKGCTKLKKIYLDGSLASGLGLQAHIPGLQVIK